MIGRLRIVSTARGGFGLGAPELRIVRRLDSRTMVFPIGQRCSGPVALSPLSGPFTSPVLIPGV